MTVVVCSSQQMQMSSDTECNDGNVKFRSIKVFKTKQGLAGFCGNTEDVVEFINWLNGEDKPSPGKGFAGILLRKDGKIYTFDRKLSPILVDQDHYAIGVGAQSAMVSMIHNHDTHMAVETACMVAPNCSLPVRTLKLGRRART